MYENNNNQYSVPLNQNFKNELLRDDVNFYIKKYFFLINIFYRIII